MDLPGIAGLDVLPPRPAATATKIQLPASFWICVGPEGGTGRPLLGYVTVQRVEPIHQANGMLENLWVSRLATCSTKRAQRLGQPVLSRRWACSSACPLAEPLHVPHSDVSQLVFRMPSGLATQLPGDLPDGAPDWKVLYFRHRDMGVSVLIRVCMRS